MSVWNDPDQQRVGFGVRWAREHYKEMIVLRLLVAVWIVFVTVFACVKGYWWGSRSFYS